VLGLNGAGKTTLLSLITRLFDTQSGTISVLGHRIDRQPSQALRRLGVVFQARTLDLDLSVMDNLLFHAALHGIGGRDARRRATAALADVDLSGRTRDKARNLSGGQMRRVEIARALLHEPSLLVLDEPTVGLDIGARADILKLVRGLIAREGMSVLWATHLTDEIAVSDEVIALHKGKVLAVGAVTELLARTGAGDMRQAFVALIDEKDQAA
jgi:ABC-2 type transport system ATP-binding protein